MNTTPPPRDSATSNLLPEEPNWPYAEWADYYFDLGWPPLPLVGKELMVKGVTGWEGEDATKEMIAEWSARFGDANIALRMPEGVIGIDVDDYDDKGGGETLRQLEEQYGELPPTWVSTSRARPSGVRLFRVPPGTVLISKIDPGIEIVQRHHRYVTVAGSINPKNGLPYGWWRPDGELSDDAPRPSDPAELPMPWRDGLAVERARVVGGKPSALAGVELLDGFANGEPDAKVQRKLGAAVSELANGCRYDAMVPKVMALLRLGELGAVGVPTALQDLKQVYVRIVVPDRTAKVAEKEFDRALRDGAVKIAADPTAGVERESRTRLIRASDINEKPLEWLWPDHLPYGKISELIGDSNTGKSLIAESDFAARVTKGWPFPGEPATVKREPMNVIITATEDGFHDVTKPRLIAAGAETDRVILFELEPDKDGNPVALTLPDRAPELRELVQDAERQYGPVGYLVISPISGHLSEDIRSHNDASVRRALGPLVKIADEHRMAVMLVRHPNKDRGMKAVDRGSGSGAFTQLVRASFGVGINQRPVVEPADAEPGEQFVFARIAANLADPKKVPALSYRIATSEIRPDHPVIEWGDTINMSADELLGKPDMRKNSPLRDEAEKVIKELLNEGPKPPKEVIDYVMNKVGCGKDTVNAASRELAVEKLPERDANGKVVGWVWKWPDGVKSGTS